MKNVAIIKYLILFIFISNISLLAYDQDDVCKFSLPGTDYTLKVARTGTGSDIILAYPSGSKNLSQHQIGENLFPTVFVQDNKYYITWITYVNGKIQLCLYESDLDQSRVVVPDIENFTFISIPEMVFIGGVPKFLVFLGNKTSNDDLFILNLDTEKIINISQTSDHEKKFSVKQVNNLIHLTTETLYHKYKYRFKIFSGNFSLVKKEQIIRIVTVANMLPVNDPVAVNRIVAFGDSITYGKMRMYNLEGDVHPELTYWAKIEEQLEADYSAELYTVELGVSKDTAQHGVDRMDADFSGLTAKFCLILFGTNDVGNLAGSMASSADSLEWICRRARDTYGMVPIISTVPPQKRYIAGLQFFTEQTETLNKLIIAMAERNNFACIDTYTAFFDHADGWEAMLEDIKGNHPSPLGHEVMRDLFIPNIVAVSPLMPENFETVTSNINSATVQWQGCYEFDFDHCNISFGFSANELVFKTQSTSNIFTFINFSYNSSSSTTIYYQVQSVDQEGNASDYSAVNSVELK